MVGGPTMANSNDSNNRQTHLINSSQALEFEQNIFDEKVHDAAEEAGLSSLIDHLEDACKIIAGLGTLCKLARNNQDLANNASEENPPLSLTTMEYLFNLGEVAARRFISEIEQ